MSRRPPLTHRRRTRHASSRFRKRRGGGGMMGTLTVIVTVRSPLLDGMTELRFVGPLQGDEFALPLILEVQSLVEFLGPRKRTVRLVCESQRVEVIGHVRLHEAVGLAEFHPDVGHVPPAGRRIAGTFVEVVIPEFGRVQVDPGGVRAQPGGFVAGGVASGPGGAGGGGLLGRCVWAEFGSYNIHYSQ